MTFVLWILSPEAPIYFLALFFLASFLIDFDHYAFSGLKTGKWNLRDSFDYHNEIIKKQNKEIKKGIKRKGDFHLFHTLEFHLFVGFLGLVWFGFFYVFAGMVFHSLLDIFSMISTGTLHTREYFMTSWIRKRI